MLETSYLFIVSLSIVYNSLKSATNQIFLMEEMMKAMSWVQKYGLIFCSISLKGFGFGKF